jgi:hypothetical protein
LRAEVIASEDSITRIAARFTHQRDEVGGPHTSVAAELIDLVASGLDQRELTLFARQFKRCRNGDRMGGTNRRDSAATAAAVLGEKPDKACCRAGHLKPGVRR